jgi:small subunit ribosomal protein S18
MAARSKRGKTGEAPLSSGRPKGRRPFDKRQRSCFFCKQRIAEIDYKSVAQLRRFISERGKIRGRGNTGTCRKHQKQVAVAIKRAREMALLPYVGDAHEPTTRPRSRGGGDGRARSGAGNGSSGQER